MKAQATPSPPRRQTVFQSSLMSALLAGVYDGELTVRELLQHGDFGLGTFNALDGEMIIVDGVCHRLRSDGGATPAAPDARTPFAVVTGFAPSITAELPADLVRDEVVGVIRRLTRSENYLYAVRVTGHFAWVRTRTVRRQDRPYQPLVEVTRGEPVQRFDDIGGVVAGFRTPLYERGIGVPGGHVHFIDAERRCGGHVLDFKITRARVELCPATDLHLALPLSDAFSRADLDPADLDQQVRQSENHR
ncbi:MAG TPA: acetolactate decarboxylase [Nakamurella sp.]|nr:acetolactate decarboxylase [Nakamurella sp.]